MNGDDYRAWVADVLADLQSRDDEDARIDGLAAALHKHGYTSDEVPFVVKDSFSGRMTPGEADRFAQQVRQRVLSLEWRNR